MSKILVMGGNQFLGKALCERLIALEHTVFALNRGNQKNVKGVFHISVDRNEENQLKRALSNLEVDYIVDISGYEPSQVSMLLDSMKGKYKQYIYISSASIYQEIQNIPVKEEDKVGENSIWGDYAKNKFLSEQEILKKIENAKYTIFRPFYIYGIGNNLDREAYIFKRIEHNLPVYLPNEGKEKIQFGYVEDLVHAIIYSFGKEECCNEIFNVGGEEIVSIKQYVELCAKAMNKAVEIRHFFLKDTKWKARDWFPFRNVNLFGNIEKLCVTGFQNQYSLLSGLQKTYQFLKKNKMLDFPELHEIEKIK
ncbi:MAG TPA: NAD-dependent epimerase/dehydratase family protein [Fusobacterium sp.]|uniref:NAD-dependent epimerase/dehydratase family protein n=1 Tax=Fusobacterium sp. TaxID=68766 RepID=UPI002F3E69D3